MATSYVRCGETYRPAGKWLLHQILNRSTETSTPRDIRRKGYCTIRHISYHIFGRVTSLTEGAFTLGDKFSGETCATSPLPLFLDKKSLDHVRNLTSALLGKVAATQENSTCRLCFGNGTALRRSLRGCRRVPCFGPSGGAAPRKRGVPMRSCAARAVCRAT